MSTAKYLLFAAFLLQKTVQETPEGFLDLHLWFEVSQQLHTFPLQFYHYQLLAGASALWTLMQMKAEKTIH